ncbi:thioesterase [Polaribacter pacificus]|uniref:Thioesterase n=1 Tax=Polaribacter pacificus TaxID=1775173 RepID=A0A917MFK1_9FLAO|nr:PaaI family thioesterase [Polaribacter pacificus]GGH03132.1 thioesterase [Polaribacter pacificus]
MCIFTLKYNRMLDKTTLLKRFNDRAKNSLMETLEIVYTDIGDDFLTAQMPVNPRVHQPLGQLHGGATAALAESVGSAASNFFIDSETQYVNGINLSINHLKSKREGMVTAIAKIIHKGRTTHLWEIRVVDEEGQLIAISKLTNIVLQKNR